MFWTYENGWGRCLKGLAVEYKVYRQPEHNIMGDKGIVCKWLSEESCLKKRKIVWFSVQKRI